jgi:hypothetical protein
MWLERIHNEKLLSLEKHEYRLLNNYRVCGKHFDYICKNPSETLLSNSLPTLHLPHYQEPSNRESCFLQAERGVHGYVTPEKIREALASASVSKELAENGSKVKTPVKTFERRGHITKKRTLFPSDELSEEAGPSTDRVFVSAERPTEVPGVSYLPTTSDLQQPQKNCKL